MTGDRIRLGAVADVHYGRDTESRLRPLFEQAARRVDILLLAGDLTDFGLPEEIEVLIRDLAALAGIPVAAVLGNHDYESGKEQELAAALRAAGVHVLDGDSCEIHGIGIAGAKGFGGGFGRGTLEPWGEAGVKQFVHGAVEEALKLERALARLHTAQRIALLHYAPIRGTVAGEPEEIFPFLGSGRLEEPINRYGVTAVFHGHAHHGAPEGRTSAGIPVYNVAVPVLKKLNGDLPLRVLEISTTAPHAERSAKKAAARSGAP